MAEGARGKRSSRASVGVARMTVAFLFPGQGSQRVGMGRELAENFALARQTFEEADQALGLALSRLCFEGPEEELRLTENAQPALLATSVAALRVFRAECAAEPMLAAGHSLGEYSALVAAGAVDFAAAVRAVRERGRLMQSACPPGAGGMAALVGLGVAEVEEICRAASDSADFVVPANLNGPGQTVVAGHSAAVGRAIRLARERGARMAVELKVSAPFHSPLMEPAKHAMRSVLAEVAFRPPAFGIVANVTGKVNVDPQAARDLLVEQVTAAVRWHDSMLALAQAGVLKAVEFGPGRVLAGLMARIDRRVTVHPVDGVASLKEACAAFARNGDRPPAKPGK